MYKFNKAEHVHTLDGKPLIGTSSLASVLNKPLVWWSSGLACEKFGWINKKDEHGKVRPTKERLDKAIQRQAEISNMSGDEYLQLCDDAYAAHSKKLGAAASAGTDMHAVMENYVKHCINKNEGKPDPTYKLLAVGHEADKVKLQILIDWSVTKVKRFIWSEVYCYSKTLWIGGISDVGYEDVDGKLAILDFKSSKEVYKSQFWQCVAYAIEVEESGGLDEDGNLQFTLDRPIDYVAVLAFGMKTPEVEYFTDMEGGKEAVKAMKVLYSQLNA